MSTGRSPARRAPTTSMAGMSPTYQARSRLDGHRVEREREDPRVRLHDPDDAGVDDALDLHAEPGPDLEDLLGAEPLADQTVRVGDDAETDARVGERLQPFATPRDDAQPQRGVRELTVEVLVDLLAVRLGDAALLDVVLQVPAPRPRPVGFDVEVGGEAGRAPVVRGVEDVGLDRALRASERTQDPIVGGEEEDATGIEQHRFGNGHDATVSTGPGWRSARWLRVPRGAGGELGGEAGGVDRRGRRGAGRSRSVPGC